MRKAIELSFNNLRAISGETAIPYWVAKTYGRFYAILESVLDQSTNMIPNVNSRSISSDEATIPGGTNHAIVGAALTQSLAREHYDIVQTAEDRDQVTTEILDCLQHCSQELQIKSSANTAPVQGKEHYVKVFYVCS